MKIAYMKGAGLVFAALLLLALLSCGGSSSGTGTTTVPGGASPLNVTDLEGATAVDPSSSFKYAFSQQVDTSTVTTSTFFLNEASADGSISKAAFDASSCDPAAAVAASVTCESALACTLDPTNDLTQGTRYTICLLPFSYSGGGIGYAKEADFDGFMAQFQTSGTAPVVDAACEATAECSTDELCFFGTCTAYAELGINSSMTCDSDGNGNQGCIDQAGGGSWTCLSLPLTTAGACSEQDVCMDLEQYVLVDGLPADSASCDADNGVWEADANLCVTDEVVSCSGDGDSEEEEEEDGYILSSINLGPPTFVIGEPYGHQVRNTEWPINFNDEDQCDELFVRMKVTGNAEIEATAVYPAVGVYTSAWETFGEGTNYVDLDGDNDIIYIYMTGQSIVEKLDALGFQSGDIAYFSVKIASSWIGDEYEVEVNIDFGMCGIWE